jgi:hypothetical protein
MTTALRITGLGRASTNPVVGALLKIVRDAVTVKAAHVRPTAGPGAGDALRDTIAGAVQLAANANINVNRVARAVMMGVLRGIRTGRIGQLALITSSAGVLVEEAVKAGEDAGAAARGAVEGTIEAVRLHVLGELRVDEAATAAATGAMIVAGEIGVDALNEVCHQATGAIAGVWVVPKEPWFDDAPASSYVDADFRTAGPKCSHAATNSDNPDFAVWDHRGVGGE